MGVSSSHTLIGNTTNVATQVSIIPWTVYECKCLQFGAVVGIEELGALGLDGRQLSQSTTQERSTCKSQRQLHGDRRDVERSSGTVINPDLQPISTGKSDRLKMR